MHQNDIPVLYLLKHGLDRLGGITSFPVQRIHAPQNSRHGNRSGNVHTRICLRSAAGAHQHRRDAAGIGNHLVRSHQLIRQIGRRHLRHKSMVKGMVCHLTALRYHLF